MIILRTNFKSNIQEQRTTHLSLLHVPTRLSFCLQRHLFVRNRLSFVSFRKPCFARHFEMFCAVNFDDLLLFIGTLHLLSKMYKIYKLSLLLLMYIIFYSATHGCRSHGVVKINQNYSVT
jgi:hypothetical protein